MDSELLRQAMGDREGTHTRLERERSRMTHQVFLLAESGQLPNEADRRTYARAATARAWMVQIADHLRDVWPLAPADLGDQVDRWFAANTERLEVIELALAHRVADGPIGDLPTRERRVDYGSAARWLGEAVGDLCDPDGEGGPAFARRVAGLLDAMEADIADRAAEVRAADPDDDRLAEKAELDAHVAAAAAAIERALHSSPGA